VEDIDMKLAGFPVPVLSLLVAVVLIASCSDDKTTPPENEVLFGSLTGHSGCGGYGLAPYRSNEGDTQTCVMWEIVDDSILVLHHHNAGFNCCPVISADVSVSNQHITIVESESYEEGGPCHCLCLFDLDFEVIGISQSSYDVTIEVVEGEPLEFSIDLAAADSGMYCESRHGYPWGDWAFN
jgi:hypothetical protein